MRVFGLPSKTAVYTANRMGASQESSCIQLDHESCNQVPVTGQKRGSGKFFARANG